MTAYRDTVRRPPKVLTEREIVALLRVTGAHVRGFRDHVLFGLALSTGLREHELLALDVGDLRAPDGRIRRRIQLRVWKRSNRDASQQEVFLNDTIRAKLERLLQLRARGRRPLPDDAPVFVSARGTRLSSRRVRSTFAHWQQVAGFDRHLTFHALRHSAVTGLYRKTKDPRLAQRFARHASPVSTAIYTHPTDDDLLAAVAQLPA